MFMRQMIKQGEMFKLDRKSNRNQQLETNSNTQLEDQQQYGVNQVRAPRSQEFRMEIDELAMKNNPAIIICGMIMCCLTVLIGSLIFYFFIFGYVKPYIPNFAYKFIPFVEKPAEPIFLSQQNAKEYFAANQLMAGQFHYSRVPVQYWAHRIETIKSMGLNALGVYVFWNYHQVSKGVFDFSTENKNLSLFLELAQMHGMDVLLRPGPYVCAEWDFGGLPTRFLNTEGLKIRQNNPQFIAQTKIYFTELSKVIKKYIKSKENPTGPILMIQVQNQPTWFTKDKSYILALKKLWDEINLGCPLYFDDIKDGYGTHPLYWDNAILAVNSWLFSIKDYNEFRKLNNFVFYGQVYAGWFSSWGKVEWQSQFHERYNTYFFDQFNDMLSVNASFSMFLAHGGTNFGLTAGFNLTTSYDYYSPINQQGQLTGKYHIFKSLVAHHHNTLPIKPPAPIPTMSTEFGQVKAISSLFESLPAPINSQKNNPLVFESNQLEMYNQGMVLYETIIKGPAQYVYQILVHDIALIYLDGKFKETLVRVQKDIELEKQQNIFTIKCDLSTCKLEILVEALGHVNFGHEQPLDHKGILKFKQLQQNIQTEETQRKWKHYRFDLQSQPNWKSTGKCSRSPCLYTVEKDLDEVKDTYINIDGFTKGYVWVNERNLGRYWEVGPQLSLYCPGVWLKKGRNTITILDLYVENANISVKTSDKPVFKKNDPI